MPKHFHIDDNNKQGNKRFLMSIIILRHFFSNAVCECLSCQHCQHCLRGLLCPDPIFFRLIFHLFITSMQSTMYRLFFCCSLSSSSFSWVLSAAAPSGTLEHFFGLMFYKTWASGNFKTFTLTCPAQLWSEQLTWTSSAGESDVLFLGMETTSLHLYTTYKWEWQCGMHESAPVLY